MQTEEDGGLGGDDRQRWVWWARMHIGFDSLDAIVDFWTKRPFGC